MKEKIFGGVAPKTRKVKNPWDFEAPLYDERSGCYIDAGPHRGVGSKQPIGHEGKAALHCDAMPMHTMETMHADYIPEYEPEIEVVKQ